MQKGPTVWWGHAEVPARLLDAATLRRHVVLIRLTLGLPFEKSKILGTQPGRGRPLWLLPATAPYLSKEHPNQKK
jgi:hypothetical protein